MTSQYTGSDITMLKTVCKNLRMPNSINYTYFPIILNRISILILKPPFILTDFDFDFDFRRNEFDDFDFEMTFKKWFCAGSGANKGHRSVAVSKTALPTKSFTLVPSYLPPQIFSHGYDCTLLPVESAQWRSQNIFMGMAQKIFNCEEAGDNNGSSQNLSVTNFCQ